MRSIVRSLLVLTAVVSLATVAWAAGTAAQTPATQPQVEQQQVPAQAAPQLDATPAPIEQSTWCAVLYARSATECESNCYAAQCGYDHWDSPSGTCYCGFRF